MSRGATPPKFPQKKKPPGALTAGGLIFGGEIGIRTLGAIADTTDFESDSRPKLLLRNFSQPSNYGTSMHASDFL